ncbi:betaine/carnitine transporter, BCCT family [Serratia sp. 121840015-2]
MQSTPKKDVTLIAISLCSIALIAICLMLFPAQSALIANTIFNGVTRLFGSTIQILVLIALLVVLYLALSKYGNIRLGEGKPQYSTLAWLFMFICAGLGSSTLYWGVMEWAYYYQTPGLNIAPRTPKALEYSISYSFFHWGLSAWATYALASLIMAYHFHVRKNKGLSLSGIISAITGVRANGPIGRMVDLIFLVATVGALTISLVLTASTFTRGLTALTGIPDNFVVQATVILLAAVIFCLSSYIGIDGGMQRLSKMVGWGAFVFAGLVLLVGPTEFTINNTINAIGLTAQNFLQMSLFTDPMGDGSFSRSWTVFYWLWWISYTPGVAMFVTRVSRGRKIKEVIWALLLGSTLGCWFFFGSLESYAMHQFISGQLNVPEILSRPTHRQRAQHGDGRNPAGDRRRPAGAGRLARAAGTATRPAAAPLVRTDAGTPAGSGQPDDAGARQAAGGVAGRDPLRRLLYRMVRRTGQAHQWRHHSLAER